MEQNFFKGKWKEAKGEIQTAWGKLTGDELEQTKGNLTSIAGLIQQKYGAKKEDVMERLNGLTERFSEKTAERTDTLKKDLRNE